MEITPLLASFRPPFLRIAHLAVDPVSRARRKQGSSHLVPGCLPLLGNLMVCQKPASELPARTSAARSAPESAGRSDSTPSRRSRKRPPGCTAMSTSFCTMHRLFLSSVPSHTRRVMYCTYDRRLQSDGMPDSCLQALCDRRVLYRECRRRRQPGGVLLHGIDAGPATLP